MSGEQFIGDIVEGALAAKSVEPGHGQSGAAGHGSACLNCGTALIGQHCHVCGQAAHVHRTLGAFFHDLLHGVFHFEGKIWRTLPLLVWNPGKLTREYIDGRRASYVSPIALFLFVVFLTFAVFSMAGGKTHFGGNTAEASNGLTESRAEADREVARLEKERAAAVAAHKPVDEIDGELEDARQAASGLRAAEDNRLPKVVATGSNPTSRATADMLNKSWSEAKKNPELTLFRLETNAHKFSWLLIPFSVPFMWLLFPFSRRFKLYDHTVFVTYSLSFMLLLLSALSLMSGWNPWKAAGGLAMALVCYAPFHMYRQLRGTYALGAFGALWRTAALSLFAVLVLLFWTLAIVGLLLAE